MLSTLTQDYVLGYSQPSLRDWVMLSTHHTQDCVLGYSQSSLRDWVMLSTHTQDYVLATLSRPFGTVHAANSYPGLRPELLSVVPAGLAHAINSPRRLAFFDRLIWTALAKNKSATRAHHDQSRRDG
jgi:hypothetical protein